MYHISVDQALKSARKKGTTRQVFGWIIAIIFGISTLAISTGSGLKEGSDVACFIIFTVITLLGVLLILLGV